MRNGEKIAAARKARGWSQEDLGWKIHVSTQAVSKGRMADAVPDDCHARGVQTAAVKGE